MKYILAAAFVCFVLLSGCIGGLTANDTEKAIASDISSLKVTDSSNLKLYSFKAGDSIDFDVIAEAAGMDKASVIEGTCAANKDAAGNKIITGCGTRKLSFENAVDMYVGIACGKFGGETKCSIDLCTGNIPGCAIAPALWTAA